MLDLFNTKFFFRCTEPASQQWISKVLGDKEEAEPTENISYGANSMRDGVSLGHQTRQKPLVIPAELSQLKDLECYIKLPGDYPCTKIWTRFQRAWGFKKEAFLLKAEKKSCGVQHTQPVVPAPTPAAQPIQQPSLQKKSSQEVD